MTTSTSNRETFIRGIIAKIENVKYIREAIIPATQKFKLIENHLDSIKFHQLHNDFVNIINILGVSEQEFSLIVKYVQQKNWTALETALELFLMTEPNALVNSLNQLEVDAQ
jgi:hypothetical protein